jgi:hypothetical protein
VRKDEGIVLVLVMGDVSKDDEDEVDMGTVRDGARDGVNETGAVPELIMLVI